MMSIVWLTLTERVRQLAWSAAGLVFLVALLAAIWPSYRDTSIGDVYGELPQSLQSLFGIEGGEFSAPVFIQAELLSFMLPVVLIGIGITAAAGTIAGEEATGRLGLLLAGPLRRHHVVFGRAVGVALELLALVVVTAVALLVSDPLVDLGLDVGRLLQALALGWLLSVVYAMLALALACWLARSGPAVGIAAAVAVVSWVAGSLGAVVEELEWFSRLTAFHAYTTGPPLVEGAGWAPFAQLLLEAAVFGAVAVVGFRRRDIA